MKTNSTKLEQVESYTAGEWKQQDQEVYVDCEDGIRTWIAQVYSGLEQGEPEANAKLISCAPELLKAVKMALLYMDGPTAVPVTADTYNFLVATVRKATT